MTRTSQKHGVRFTGNIAAVRAVEDTIRATRKYTEGITIMRAQHPVQGEEFPSRVFCKYYEVYPETEISWDMPIGVALDWLWRDIPCVDVVFRYDYRENKASVMMSSGQDAVDVLSRHIPAFGRALLACVTSLPAQNTTHHPSKNTIVVRKEMQWESEDHL